MERKLFWRLSDKVEFGKIQVKTNEDMAMVNKPKDVFDFGIHKLQAQVEARRSIRKGK